MKTIDAIISYNKSDDLYTIYTMEQGGMISSDKSLDKAKSKFENGMSLYISVYNILNRTREYIGNINYRYGIKN